MLLLNMNPYDYANINKIILDLEERGIESHRASEFKGTGTWHLKNKSKEEKTMYQAFCSSSPITLHPGKLTVQ